MNTLGIDKAGYVSLYDRDVGEPQTRRVGKHFRHYSPFTDPGYRDLVGVSGDGVTGKTSRSSAVTPSVTFVMRTSRDEGEGG